MTPGLPALMRHSPGYLPWYVGGDPWFTYDEIAALQQDARRREAREARRPAPAARARPARRPPRRR